MRTMHYNGDREYLQIATEQPIYTIVRRTTLLLDSSNARNHIQINQTRDALFGGKKRDVQGEDRATFDPPEFTLEEARTQTRRGESMRRKY